MEAETTESDMSDGLSFLEEPHIFLYEIEWHEDDLGVYWTAKFRNGQNGKIGNTGSYYTICEDGLRPSMERQQSDLRKYGIE